jgi:hypothetical protein
MKRHMILTVALLLGSAATLLVAVPGVALAQIPLQPVQYVYPDSTLAEIQQALDTGGTVYFDRLTKVSRQYGEYNQVARNFPDLPPSSSDPAKGFNVGTYGKEVHIIGLLGPNRERPKINGGTIVFRIGTLASVGFLGLPVDFRIENLELFNPDLGMPQLLYSRIGIWINILGARSTVHNCKITVTGKETDPGHAVNHSVAIWFYLPTTQPPAPPSGATIDITNNTIIVSRAHEGLHADSFWPVTPGVTPPRVFIGNNTVDVTKLGGYPNKGGTNGATIGTAVVLTGNVPNSIVTNNTIRGDGRSPNATPPVEALGLLAGLITPNDTLTNVTIAGNDLSGFTGHFQMRMRGSLSTVALNSFGSADGAGVLCSGDHNNFVNNRFYGPYPGWAPPANGPGLFWFTGTGSGNTVESTKLNGGPNGMDICGQVRDDTGGANEIRGYERCGKN